MKKTILLLATPFLALIGSVQGAAISWNTVIASTNGLAPTDIFYQGAISSWIPSLLPADQANSLVYAHDVLNTNGVPSFTATGLAGPDIAFVTQTYLGNGPFDAGSPATTDGGLNNLLDNMRWQSGTQTTSFSLGGLTPGKLYEVQLFSGDDRGCCSSRTHAYEDPFGTGTGQLALGTWPTAYGSFVADAATQSITLNGSNHPYLSAIVLYTVPEPSRGMLLAMGAAGLVMRRRR